MGTRCLVAIVSVFGLLASPPAPDPIRVQGTGFVQANGRPFHWRGITAFRLVEQIASGRQADADRYLAWAAGHDLTIVRVLTMAKQVFELPPDRGAASLPALLALAAARGLHVEVVALADTASYTFDVKRHVTAIGAACAAAGNCTVEIANEPYHGTQADAIHDRAYLRQLRPLVPPGIPVALGAAERPEASGGGDYATVHLSRDTREGGWAHVRAIAASKGLPARLHMPVVSDEPIGAAERLEPGRRDNAPERFRAAAEETRKAGLGATFHYSGGIQAAIPTRTELACFEAWRKGLLGL